MLCMSSHPKNPIEIRYAQPKDRDVLAELFLKLLQFLDQFEHDMLPTLENAQKMTDQVFMPAATRREPILIAWDEEKPVGAIFWPIQNIPYSTRWKTAFGYGTYLDKEYRNKKLGTEMKRRAIEILKLLGVQKLLGTVLLKNEIAVKFCDHQDDYVPFARVDILHIQ